MNAASKCLKAKPPIEPKSPEAAAICAYAKALDDQCRKIIEEEAANGDAWAIGFLKDLEADD